jgi:hypothetical protein
MLPPGTFKALKGHHNGIVTVTLFVVALGGLVAGSPHWADIALLAIAFGMFHIRCGATETHMERMAQLKVDEASLKAEAIKARHRELLMVDQPALPLERRPRQLSQDRRRGQEEQK